MALIIKLTLTISLLGIIILLILTNTLQPTLKNIEDITTKDLNKKAKVQGIIINIKSFEESNFQILTLSDSTGKIDITTNKILNLKKGQQITVVGRVTDYKQDLQIEAEKIILNPLT